jgi:plasmid maintenance system antidote protein VapI
MRAIIRELLNDLEKFNRTPESVGYDLRLDLAELVLEELRAKKWSKADLARAAGMHPPFLTRIVNSDSNCTFEVAGRICHALGVRPKLMRAPETFAITQLDKQYGQAQIVSRTDFRSAAVGHKTFTGSSELRLAHQTRELCAATNMG